jgi:4-hydroxybenzoate polyprenyltransferase
VIKYIEEHRLEGGKSVLITGSSQVYADKVSGYLKLFDEAYGTRDGNNLTGKAKRDFIHDFLGFKSFSYIGNSKDDLHVWRHANKIITVNTSKRIRKEAEGIGKPSEHLLTDDVSVLSYFKLMRTYQWLKNMLIFLPILAAHQLDRDNIVTGLLGFFSFSLVASSVYVLNDLLDLGHDRSHPRKRSRPLAAGDLSIANALLLMPVLLLFGFGIGAVLGFNFVLVLALYLILTTLYSVTLKTIAVLDIVLLGALYSLRVFAGGVSSDITLSFWLIAFSTLFFLALAAVKRQAELIDALQRGASHLAGRGYEPSDLPIINMVGLVSGFAAVQVLALYVNSEKVQELYKSPEALWGVCCILLYWVIRIVFVTNRGLMTDDPILFMVKDKVSYACLILMSAFLLVGVGSE